MSLQSILPPIFIPPHDDVRLRRIASPLAKRGAWTGQFLISELDRAVPCSAGALPADTVVMGSRVSYCRDGSGEAQCGLLVYPEDWVAGFACISVLSPEGAALIGLRLGNAMRFRGPSGKDRTVIVTSVETPAPSNVVPFRRRRSRPSLLAFRPEPDGAA